MSDAQDAVPMNTAADIAVMRVEVQYIKESVERIERSGLDSVPKAQWEQRNIYVDARIAELAARRAPWWSVAAIIISASALAVVLIPTLAS